MGHRLPLPKYFWCCYLRMAYGPALRRNVNPYTAPRLKQPGASVRRRGEREIYRSQPGKHIFLRACGLTAPLPRLVIFLPARHCCCPSRLPALCLRARVDRVDQVVQTRQCNRAGHHLVRDMKTGVADCRTAKTQKARGMRGSGLGAWAVVAVEGSECRQRVGNGHHTAGMTRVPTPDFIQTGSPSVHLANHRGDD
jgi:hypothetical protein